MVVRKLSRLILFVLFGGLIVTIASAQSTPNNLTHSSVNRGSIPASVKGNQPYGISNQPLSAQPREQFILTHSDDQTVQPNVSVSCIAEEEGTEVQLGHRETSFYRAYTLADFGITEDSQVELVEVGVDLSLPDSEVGYQAIDVYLYVLSEGTEIVLTNLILIGEAHYWIPGFGSTQDESAYLVMPVNGVVFADETLVVEIRLPDGVDDTGSEPTNFFFIGANGLGQTGPSYIKSNDCGITEIDDLANLGYPDVHNIINVGINTLDGEIPAAELLTNGDFEFDYNDNKIPDGWNEKELTGDKVKCNKPDKDIAYSGECLFQFKGVEGEGSKLQQSIDMTKYPELEGDQVYFSAAVLGKNTIEGGRVKLRVKYADVNNPTGKINLLIPTGTYEFDVLTSDTIELAGEVSKIKLIVENKAASGKFRIDASSLTWALTGEVPARSRAARVEGLVPMPPAPAQSGLNSRGK